MRLKVTLAPDDVVPATTRLGDWYANLLFRPGGQIALFVNERSLLPVLVPAKPADTLLSRFRSAATDVLTRIGVPSPAIEAELREMADVRIGKTASRQVLGSMNDFALLLDAYVPATLIEIALKLASAPCSPIGMKSPAAVASEILCAE